MRKFICSFVCSFVLLVAGLLAAASAQATTLTAVDLLHDFNAVIFHDASTTADIEGASIIGGSFSGATVYGTPKGVLLPASFNALNVYGDNDGGPVNLNNGGSAYVGGARNAVVNFNGGGGYAAAAPSMSLSEIQTELTNYSLYLSTLAANSTLPTPDNNEVITATPDASGIAVFDVSVGDLGLIPSYGINLNGATTVVFNVSGSVLDFTANYQGNDSIFGNVIWNFYQATDLTFETLIGGTVLAPYATVTNRNQIDGALVADSWNGQGELHEYPFDGPPPPTATPEPATMVLSAAGLALLGLVRRRAAR
ncbi:Choice-of-anchor A domain containing protein [Desulfovibrio sp. X2]|uniref:choice-of-anchor A family protein n=1 Tax=Desulfovibrio sp. X2 TaxID=941449 RepID=UPI000358DFF2|nr:choice-of-anchor A family protein [Desulfovibrio sp. X2]EPR42107.1 Choice-of-anchor A domain containing protein [Desulfovibrio sp. X2]